MKDNFLNYIPSKNVKFICNENVILLQENTGVFNRLFQKFFRKPKITEISLDERGTVVWKLIDGKNTVYDIYNKTNKITSMEQLVVFISTLFKYKFIIYVT